ncbi:MAG: hypothetical protein ACKO16_12380 [Gemmataceae bacterium]
MNITRQILDAFIDDHLNEQETIKVEKALRESPELQAQLTDIIKSRDMGDHSIGAIWRREHLSCPSREELLSYQDEALDLDRLDYIKFHLETVGCRACKANLSDLKNVNPLPEDPALRKKHQQFLENSKILLPQKN